MNALWAPWRIQYIQETKTAECFLCTAAAASAAGPDRDHRIAYRGDRVFAILNSYPYNPGHLMVAPARHLAALVDLDGAERAELMDVAALSTQALTDALRAEAFNLGLNLGRAAGAGLEGHLHLHIVPRWTGDTNFMPVLADVKVIPEHLDATYEKIRAAYDALRAP